MSVLNAQSVGEKIISQDIFGSNILATRDQLGQGGTFDDVADTLGLQSLRYPGGSLTEHYFDLADPDRKTVTDINSNDQIDFYPIHSFYSMPKHRKKTSRLSFRRKNTYHKTPLQTATAVPKLMKTFCAALSKQR